MISNNYAFSYFNAKKIYFFLPSSIHSTFTECHHVTSNIQVQEIDGNFSSCLQASQSSDRQEQRRSKSDNFLDAKRGLEGVQHSAKETGRRGTNQKPVVGGSLSRGDSSGEKKMSELFVKHQLLGHGQADLAKLCSSGRQCQGKTLRSITVKYISTNLQVMKNNHIYVCHYFCARYCAKCLALHTLTGSSSKHSTGGIILIVASE